jgi:hypothetical protein
LAVIEAVPVIVKLVFVFVVLENVPPLPVQLLNSYPYTGTAVNEMTVPAVYPGMGGV